MREHTKRQMVQDLYKAGMSRQDIIKGMKSVYTPRYDKSRLDRDLQGLSKKDIVKDSNYLKEYNRIKEGYKKGFISKKTYQDYKNKKPENMVIGYSLYRGVSLKTMKPSIKEKIEEFYEYGNYWVEGSP